MNNYSAYYQMLGLAPDTDFHKIRKAFREKAKLYHPDINPSPYAQSEFIRIRKAFEALAREHQKGACRPEFIQHGAHNRGYTAEKHFVNNGRSFGRKSFKNDKIDFFSCLQGKIIYCTAHLIFITVGLFIFIDPVIIVLQHKFDPLRPLYDSIFASIVTMIFGMVMVWRIGLSLNTFIRKRD